MKNQLEKRLQSQGDSRTVFGRPVMVGQPIPPIVPNAKASAINPK